MDACIARGGISHVLSQARASLKNPSRPFTPRTTGRSLFQGDDYRPGSRPSSSYSVAEQKGGVVDTKPYAKQDPTATGPSGSSLPPRPAAKTTKTRSAGPTPPPKDAQVKLMHAPVLHDQESTGESSDGELSGEEQDDPEVMSRSRRGRDEEDLLESSLEIPRSEALAQTLNTIESQLSELSRQPPATLKRQALDTITSALTAFSTSSAVCLPRRAMSSSSSSSSSRRPPASPSMNTAGPETARVWTLRRRLFDCLVDMAVGAWQLSARGVVAITPCVLELYQLGFGSDGLADEDADAKVVAMGKVLFVLSKDSGNDAEFCNVHYVESAIGLLATANASRAQSSKQPNPASGSCPMKTLIYVAGTLKNISSGDDKIIKLLATNGAIAALSDTLLWRSKDTAECKEIAQLLVQTTTILRNLSTSKNYLKQFNEAQVTCRLCETVPVFLHHQELMVNVSRTLGKLTLHEVPRSQINHDSERYVGSLVKLVDPRTNPTLSFATNTSSNDNQSETKSQDVLLVRLFFVLGNLCAGNDHNRQFLGLESGAITALLQSLQHYGSVYVHLHGEQQDAVDHGTKSTESVSDVLVKLVRLIANMAMNADVGNAFNAQGNDLAILLDVLECAQASGCDEELMLNIVSCITNLSYYCSASHATSASSFIESHRLQIATQLAHILWDSNEEAVLEAARAFGNLSRFKDVLRAMGDHKVLDGFVILLDHSNREIVYTVCGVLMNAALDQSARTMLSNVRQVHSGVGDAVIDARMLLVGILECAALDDIDMSCIAAKVLYNLLLTKKDAASEAYIASEDGATLQRIVSSILRSLRTSSDEDTERDGDSSTRAELQGVLTQLQRNLK